MNNIIETDHQLQDDFPFMIVPYNNHEIQTHPKSLHVMHFHHDLQLIYVDSGSIEVITLDNTYTINEHEAIFINKDVAHCVIKNGIYHYTCLFFDKDILELKYLHHLPSIKQDICIIKDESHQKELEILKTLIENYKQYDMYEILVYLHMLYLYLLKRKDINTTSTKAQSRVNDFLYYLQNHYQEDITLEMIAQSGYVSVSECLRCFKEVLHITPYQYLMNLRLEKAKQLLIESNDSIGSICESVGFHQVSNFGKCFKELTGYSPRTYRSIYLEKGERK